jgi:hypothetical protein
MPYSDAFAAEAPHAAAGAMRVDAVPCGRAGAR